LFHHDGRVTSFVFSAILNIEGWHALLSLISLWILVRIHTSCLFTMIWSREDGMEHSKDWLMKALIESLSLACIWNLHVPFFWFVFGKTGTSRLSRVCVVFVIPLNS
jgi:hypothetical protein